MGFLGYVAFVALLVTLQVSFTTGQELKNTNLWDKCIDFPVLGDSCLDVYAVLPNLTLAVSLTIGNKTYLDFPLVQANQLCLTDAQLLQLLALTPPLLPFAPLIEALILAERFIPADVYSVCLEIYNLNVTRHQAQGCALLSANLMCFHDHCLFKGDKQFGCFDVAIPVENKIVIN